MPDIVITEFMDETPIHDLARRHDTLYQPDLVDRPEALPGALDVYAREPLTAEAAAVFMGAPNLILTPHIAGVSVESNIRVSAVTAANVLKALEELS